jgi:hypothetical protein
MKKFPKEHRMEQFPKTRNENTLVVVDNSLRDKILNDW